MGGSPRMPLSFVGDRFESLSQQITSQSRLVFIVFAGLAVSLLLFSAAQAPPAQAWLQGFGYGKEKPDREKILKNAWNNRSAEWELPAMVEGPNWVGLQKMREERIYGSPTGSSWWDEKAEQYFISKLEENQFPANCSQAHWIAHYDWVAGLLSGVHVLTFPLLFSMVRGHPLLPIAVAKHPAFLGCSENKVDRNTQCFFNITNCNPTEDPSRFSEILAMTEENERTTWEELLMADDDIFTPGGVTVSHSFKWPPWDTEVTVPTSSFSSYREAVSYNTQDIWKAMGRAGKVGIVAASDKGKTNLKSCGEDWDIRPRRVDQVIVSLMSSWMLNQMHDNVKSVADQIMLRYTDTSGKPLWKAPVLVIHVRQTDKSSEDPYWREHGGYRPIEDYAMRINQMEVEYGFRFPTVFLISDNGTTLESLAANLSGNDSASPGEEVRKRYIMYDWIEDDHLVEKFINHMEVPPNLKYDLQTHFLATLYITQKIADHAIVTYSSNVGRFIGEIIFAKHRMAFADCDGPLVTSLDSPWFWI